VRTRAIAEAKIKTDKVDAETLVRLLAGGWLPEVWRRRELEIGVRAERAYARLTAQWQSRPKRKGTGAANGKRNC
jgi:transposase